MATIQIMRRGGQHYHATIHQPEPGAHGPACALAENWTYAEASTGRRAVDPTAHLDAVPDARGELRVWHDGRELPCAGRAW